MADERDLSTGVAYITHWLFAIEATLVVIALLLLLLLTR
jgi:hypothetical protein